MTEELENLLRSYVEDQRRQNVAGAVQKIFDKFVEHEAKDEGRHAELRGEMKGLSLRVGELERDRDKLEDWAEETGRHEIGHLRDNATWWRRFAINGAFAVASAAIAGFITWIFGVKK